jgi:periplasmic protein TonB
MEAKRRQRGNLETIVVGTLLVHLALLTIFDVGGTWARRHPETPPPEEIELDDTPPPPPPPPKVQPAPPPPPVKAPEPAPPQVVHRAVTHETTARPPTPTHETPPPETHEPTPTDQGGQEAYKLPEGPTGGVAVPVAHGQGAGGTGHGAGGGSGDGQASPEARPQPVSIAAIKTRAKPRGDYSYFGAGKDYPPEARQLGIEGVIRVRLIVDPKGKVVGRTLLNKLGHGLDELALERASQIEFDPALDDRDQPVTSLVVWTFDFKLPK